MESNVTYGFLNAQMNTESQGPMDGQSKPYDAQDALGLLHEASW